MSQYQVTIEERIDRDVKMTLETICGGGNFPFSATVQWGRVQGNDIKANTIIVTPGALTPQDTGSWNRDHYRKAYTVFVPVLSHQEDTQPDSEKQSNASGAVIKALMTDVTRTDQAINTYFIGSTPEDDPPGVSLGFEVHFWTAKDDPFNE